MKLKNVKKIASTILNVVKAAEDLYSGYEKSGKLKKAWAVEVLNEKFDIPWIGEKTEAKILGILIDIVVEVWQQLKD
jgi:hypothetical protein